MAEKTLVVDQMKLTYEGIFDLNGMYRTIDSWFYEKGYDKYEKKNSEIVTAKGKDIEIELMPWKRTTDYFTHHLRIRMKFVDVTDVEVNKQDVRLRLQQGKIMMIFDAYLETDYENKWSNKPMLFFLKTIFDKYVFKGYFKTNEKWLVNDLFQLHGRIQQFLNVYRYDKHV